MYREFIVDLKELPAEKSSQRKNWTIHLSEEEAQVVLGEYSRPQREVERLLTPYIVPPPVMPHLVANSIYRQSEGFIESQIRTWNAHCKLG